MAYAVAWDENVPEGSDDADTIDDRIQDRMTAIRERVCDLLGGLTLLEFQADPIVGAKGLRGSGAASFVLLGGTTSTIVKDSTGVNSDLIIDHTAGNVAIRGDVTAAGGYRQLFDGWLVTDVAASVAATEVVRTSGRVLMTRAGSVTGVAVCLGDGQVRATGSITVEVWKGVIAPATGVRTDSATGLTAVLDVSNTAVKATTQAKDTDLFAAGDELFVKYTTTSDWTPVTADLRVSIEVEL